MVDETIIESVVPSETVQPSEAVQPSETVRPSETVQPSETARSSETENVSVSDIQHAVDESLRQAKMETILGELKAMTESISKRVDDFNVTLEHIGDTISNALTHVEEIEKEEEKEIEEIEEAETETPIVIEAPVETPAAETPPALPAKKRHFI